MVSVEAVNPTPQHWRHVRVIDAPKGKFSVVSYYVRSRFGPLSLAALGMDVDTKTEGIGKADALDLGAKLEKVLLAINGVSNRRKK